MAKQIAITISDEMYAKVQKLKDELTGKNGKRKLSKICQKAIGEALIEAEASFIYRLEGIKDGKRIASTLSMPDKEYISRILSKSGPYKKWSRSERIEELKLQFEEIKNIDIDSLYPKFRDIMDGTSASLHPWVEVGDKTAAADRKAEMAWSYVEGCYRGINDEYQQITKKGDAHGES